jgi:chemotaxis protein histidine kinase CheA
MNTRTAQTEVRQGYDRTQIDQILEHHRGALYAITHPMGKLQIRNILTYSTVSNDWNILYNGKYNDIDKLWESHLSLWKRGQEKAELSTRLKKTTQKTWDTLDEKWKKERVKQRRSALREEKKIMAEIEKRNAERKLEAEQKAKDFEKDRKRREKEIKAIEAEEEKARLAKEKKKKAKSKPKSKAKPKATKPKSKTTAKPKKPTGKKTKWRDMKAQLDDGTLDQFM